MKSSVLVVGAGIAGMRAAAELLQHGLKVHLLESGSRIGGMMARIHRVYPTHEHPACALFPLTTPLLDNPNLTILTSAELGFVQGRAGQFQVRVLCRESGGSDRPAESMLEIGAVIIATGLEEERDPALTCHGRFSNVITGLECERQLSPLGPTGGDIRLASETPAQRVAWIVRTERAPVTFMSATAQARGAQEADRDRESTILFDKRPRDGHGYEEYVREAEQRGIRYIQVSSVETSQEATGQLSVSYVGADGDPGSLQTDMLVLSAPLIPREETRALAERLGLKLDGDGFFERDPATGHPVSTSREGVFVCGAVQGAEGIAESVIQACAAASHAAALLTPVRGTEVAAPVEKSLVPVRPNDEPQILVVIDRGGEEVPPVLDLDELASYTRNLPGVRRVEVAQDVSDGAKIREWLETGEFNRLVVAGPSPITHETVLQRHTESGRLNRYLLEMVNLHKQCAQVHSQDIDAARQKAKTLMKMGVLRARRLEPLEDLTVSVTQSCLVIGGSPSGIACATRLASMGTMVHLLESESDPGAVAGNDHPLVRPMVAGLATERNIEVHSPATVGDIRGHVGNFEVEIVGEAKREILTFGAIVLASRTDRTAGFHVTPLETSLRLERDENGRYVTTQGILNPLDLTTDGVFVCGPARAALDTERQIIDGEAAASRAGCILSSPIMVRPPVISKVVDKNCDGCAYCVEPCPTRSISLLEFVQNKEIKKVVEVEPATCIGCGICMATCPKDGAFVRHFKGESFAEMVQGALEDACDPLIICFCCNRCAYPGADTTGRAGIQYPANVRIIRAVCAGMIHPNIITNALTTGVDGVLLCGCHPGECRSREGIRKAQSRSEGIGLLLEDFGLEQERFRLEFIAASEGPKFARVVKEMTEELAALGPSPYRPNGTASSSALT